MVPLADPFGQPYGTDPRDPTLTENRLGWLGTHQRYTTSPASGIIRMGVRLYDPALGRFLEVDPIEGGSCNDYDYVCGDSLNSTDLDGNALCTRFIKIGDCRSKARKVQDSLRTARTKLRSIKRSHDLTDFQLRWVDQAVRAINTTLDCVNFGGALGACTYSYLSNLPNVGRVAGFLSSPINSTFGLIAGVLGCSANSLTVLATAIQTRGRVRITGGGTTCLRLA